MFYNIIFYDEWLCLTLSLSARMPWKWVRERKTGKMSKIFKTYKTQNAWGKNQPNKQKNPNQTTKEEPQIYKPVNLTSLTRKILEQVVKLTNHKYPEDSREMGNRQHKFIKNCDTIVTRFFIENCVNYFFLSQDKRLVLLPGNFLMLTWLRWAC